MEVFKLECLVLFLLCWFLACCFLPTKWFSRGKIEYAKQAK